MLSLSGLGIRTLLQALWVLCVCVFVHQIIFSFSVEIKRDNYFHKCKKFMNRPRSTDEEIGNATQTGLDVTTGQECTAQLCFIECSCGPWRSYSPFPLKSWHLYMMGSFKMFWCLNTAEESTFCPWKLIVSALVRLLFFFHFSISSFLFQLTCFC